MSGGAVLLGAWICQADLSIVNRLFLSAAAFFSTGFGNIINDIIDIESDRINHPDRPLPTGILSKNAAWIYCLFCAVTALFCAFSVAPLYGYATILPLFLLTLYSFYLKGTPLTGNILVSFLVAYSLLFGSLEAKNRIVMYLPAMLAMLLNFSREIIKDLQDDEGDRAVGMVTSASLPPTLLKKILTWCSGIYAIVLFTPVITGICRNGYLATVLILVVPLHTIRFFYFIKSTWIVHTRLMSKLIKYEMLAGLLALTIDQLGR